nr:MAG TPA: hypothetical protein [Caudoviricetes sp.]
MRASMRRRRHWKARFRMRKRHRAGKEAETVTRDEREERERKQVSREIGLMRMRLEKMEKISDYSYPSTREQFIEDMEKAIDGLRRAEDSVMRLKGFCGYIREWW